MKFNLLTDHVIHGTEFWTPTNIADGLNALAICIEVRGSSSICKGSVRADGPIQMIFFSVFMMWSFPWKEYQVQPDERHTRIWRPLWDSINFCMYTLFSHGCTCLTYFVGDFAVEIGSELSYFGKRLTGRRALPPAEQEFGQAFGATGYSPADGKSRGGAYALPVARMSYDDDIRLTPYAASQSRGQSASPDDNVDRPETEDIESPPQQV